ncbi:phosphatase domain-containing protein [Aurantibacter sp.]|uniref:App1 family protein n=1 Tax=Aurantibacter sp. TaxID=2807103 RepID=UPI003264295A
MALFGKKDKLQIISFQTYGTEKHLYLRGRALEDERIDLAEKGFFNLLKNTWKRFETDEIKHAEVKVDLGDARSLTTKTDNHGYYLIDEARDDLSELTNSEGWVNFEISYADMNLKREVLHQNRFPGEMLIPAQTSDFGVISDIDDTILHTGVVSSIKWRVLINTFFTRAISRKPLEGTAELYHLLHRGKSGNNANPIFYVSHSPWNLYRYLELFLQTNNFPKGPILLRSMASFGKKTEKPHKQHEILNILKTYPKLSFLLFGDCGEKDADIYIDVAKKYPKQVKAIYLRSVNDVRRMTRIRDLVKSFELAPILIVDNSQEVIEHAKINQFI